MKASNKRLEIEDVRARFKMAGCELVSTTYVNSDTPLEYRCPCGSISKIRLYNLKESTRCRSCVSSSMSERQRTPYEEVFKKFEESGCRLISEEYVNDRSPLRYICICGNEAATSFGAFKKGHRCASCGAKEAALKTRHSYGYVYSVFKEAGCLLTSKEYVNARTPLKYICECGEASEIRFDNFIQRKRCKQCGIAKNTGKNNVMYNHDLTEEERIIRRNTPEYRGWRTAVYERDDYTCYKCNVRGGVLNAHHINAYNIFPELRHDVSNGVTLCTPCHLGFHKDYGFGYNTVEQFEEWLGEEAIT